MKRSVLTALVLPSVIAVTMGGTALMAPTASAAPAATSTATAAPADESVLSDPAQAPDADEGGPAAGPPSVGSAPVGPAVEAGPTESSPTEAKTEVPAADEASEPGRGTDAGTTAPALTADTGAEAEPDTGGEVGTAAATEPGTVTVSGETRLSDTQRAVTDGWPAGTTFTYQWTRDGADIDGAVGETYVLVGADMGRVVEVAVTGTGPGPDDEPATVVSDRRVAAGVAPTFTAQPGTDLTVVAGEPYSFTWEAAGDPTPMVVSVADPRTLVSTLPAGATVTETPGALTISGTSTYAGSYSFGVSTLNMVGIGELLVVDLEVQAAAPASIFATVYTTSATGPWAFAGAVGSSPDDDVLAVSVDDGQSVVLAAYAGDEFGNAVPREALPEGSDEPVYRSSGPGDEAVVLDTGYQGFTVHGAGTRVMSASLAGFTLSFPVEVRSTAVLVPAGSGAAPTSSAGSLAYTGGEPTQGLVALAAGLLAAGTVLTVVRLRRRATS